MITSIALLAMAAGTSSCGVPMVQRLDATSTVVAHAEFACPGKLGSIEVRGGCGQIVGFSGDYRRGSALVDRDGSVRLRLIDGRERASDLSWHDGQLTLRRGRRVVRRAVLPGDRCST